MGRDPKDGVRRTVRFDNETNAAIDEDARLHGLDISSMLAVVLRRHYGLDGREGCQEAREVALRASRALPRIEVAYELLTAGQHPSELQSEIEAVRSLDPLTLRVWEAWWELRRAAHFEEKP